MQNEIVIRPLEPGELAFPETLPSLPAVVERRADRPDLKLLDTVRARPALRALLEEHGAVLFRGFGVAAPDEIATSSPGASARRRCTTWRPHSMRCRRRSGSASPAWR
jgi:hypothetical protein